MEITYLHAHSTSYSWDLYHRGSSQLRRQSLTNLFGCWPHWLTSGCRFPGWRTHRLASGTWTDAVLLSTAILPRASLQQIELRWFWPVFVTFFSVCFGHFLHCLIPLLLSSRWFPDYKWRSYVNMNHYILDFFKRSTMLLLQNRFFCHIVPCCKQTNA